METNENETPETPQVGVNLNGRGGLILEVADSDEPIVIKFDDYELSVSLFQFILENTTLELVNDQAEQMETAEEGEADAS